MKLGAVIAASGRPDRTEETGSPEKHRGMAAVRQMIAVFHRIGITEIAVVTGSGSEETEKQIRRSGAVCIRTENLGTAEMTDSAGPGMRYLKDKCDALFLAFADAPLFAVKTAMKIRDYPEGQIRIPTCGGRDSYPVYIETGLIPQILSCPGSRETAGFPASFGPQIRRIEVEDPGMSNEVHPEIKVRLTGDEPFFGPGTARLLRQVEYCGSLAEASQMLNISYSKARTMIRRLEKQLDCRAIETQRGGTGGGRAAVTREGRELLEKYERFEKEIEEYATEKYLELF